MGYRPGETGNPGGRPAKTQQQRDFEAKCRDWSALYAFDKLKGWVDHENPKVATWALSELLNRGFGKSVETSVIDATVTPLAGKSAEDLAREAADLLGLGAGEGCGVPPAGQVDPGK